MGTAAPPPLSDKTDFRSTDISVVQVRTKAFSYVFELLDGICRCMCLYANWIICLFFPLFLYSNREIMEVRLLHLGKRSRAKKIRGMASQIVRVGREREKRGVKRREERGKSQTKREKQREKEKKKRAEIVSD